MVQRLTTAARPWPTHYDQNKAVSPACLLSRMVPRCSAGHIDATRILRTLGLHSTTLGATAVEYLTLWWCAYRTAHARVVGCLVATVGKNSCNCHVDVSPHRAGSCKSRLLVSCHHCPHHENKHSNCFAILCPSIHRPCGAVCAQACVSDLPAIWTKIEESAMDVDVLSSNSVRASWMFVCCPGHQQEDGFSYQEYLSGVSYHLCFEDVSSQFVWHGPCHYTKLKAKR